MDADLQDPPEEIPRLLRSLGDRDGVVFGRRISHYQSPGRHATGIVFKRILWFCTGRRIPTGVGTFLAMSRTVVDAAISRAGRSPYLPLLLAQTGFPLWAVDVQRVDRSTRESGYTAIKRAGLGLRALLQGILWRIVGPSVDHSGKQEHREQVLCRAGAVTPRPVLPPGERP